MRVNSDLGIETTETVESEIRSAVLTEPAVGIIATRKNGDSIIRTIARARQRGFHTLVINPDNAHTEALELAQDLGATVLTGHSDRSVKRETALIRIAKAYGFPGLIFHENSDLYIDFDASVDLLSESEQYAIRSQSYSRYNETDRRSVMAAIPAYNESSTISQVVRDCVPHVDQVLVIDDGSDDETREQAEAAGANVISHEKNAGYGAALKTAFKEARDMSVDHLVILDGDGQHEPADINRIIAKQNERSAELVIGSRFVNEGENSIPLYRRIGLAIINILTNFSIGTLTSSNRISDTQSGFRSYDRTAIESLALDWSIGDRMNASTDILFHAQRQGYRIEEIGTRISYDVENASTINPVTHGLSLVNNILVRIERERPVTVLGIPGLLSIVIGLAFSNWTITEYLNTQTLSVGLAVIATLFLLIGLFASFTSIILHSLNTSLQISQSSPHRRP